MQQQLNKSGVDLRVIQKYIDCHYLEFTRKSFNVLLNVTIRADEQLVRNTQSVLMNIHLHKAETKQKVNNVVHQTQQNC